MGIFRFNGRRRRFPTFIVLLLILVLFFSRSFPTSSRSSPYKHRIQYPFPHSFRARQQLVQQDRLDAVKSELLHAWNGYKTRAWMKDELRPVSGQNIDKFCGWAATLVDSLDVLWIMGLKEEFEEAVHATASIDFESNLECVVNLFETTIRHLGGIIAAYDLSQHPALLPAMVQLGDMLHSRFNTPNGIPCAHCTVRRPEPSEQYVSSSNNALAALGTLALEFTRLSAITGDTKYVNSTNHLQRSFADVQFESTLPGMWPEGISGSGSGWGFSKGAMKSSHAYSLGALSDSIYEYLVKGHLQAGTTNPVFAEMWHSAAQPIRDHLIFRPFLPGNPDILFSGTVTVPDIQAQKIQEEQRRQKLQEKKQRQKEEQRLREEERSRKLISEDEKGEEEDDDEEIVPQQEQQLQEDSQGDQSSFSETGFPASHISRRSLPDSSDIGPSSPELSTRSFDDLPETTTTFSKLPEPSGPVRLDPLVQHLACFQGGLFALAGRIFSSPHDLDIGRRLTLGCVHAYNMTPTGIMPEIFTVFPCHGPHENNGDNNYTCTEPPFSLTHLEDLLRERSNGQFCDHRLEVQTGEASDINCNPMTFLEQDKHYPRGIVRVNDGRYLLRPEAIESVFIMWRLTGDPIWREHGWNMFQSIIRVSKAEFGHSAIDSVLVDPANTSPPPSPTSDREEDETYDYNDDEQHSGIHIGGVGQNGKFKRSPPPRIPAPTTFRDWVEHTDEMESFWLAETLKYFYLLFSDPDLVSLDDFVLNTEAHPLRLRDGERGY